MTDIPKTVEEWSKQVSESGITGSVTMVADNGSDRNVRQIDVGGGAISDYHTKIPGDMVPHIHEILRERDRMMKAALKVIIEIPDEELNSRHLAGMRQSCLLMAIDVIRKKYAAPLIDAESKTIEDTSAIPDDMSEHTKLIFEVRDKLWENASSWWGRETPEYAEYKRIEQENPDWPRGKIMNAVLLPVAIKNTRLVKGKDHGTTADSADERSSTEAAGTSAPDSAA